MRFIAQRAKMRLSFGGDRMHITTRAGFVVPLAASSFAASAQSSCSPPAGAPSWMPCGPDRALDEAEIRGALFRAGEVTTIHLTGGTSGRKFVLALQPDGKLDMGVAGGANFGRDWKLEGGKLCLRAWQNVWRGQFNCGAVELKESRLSWVEPDSRNPIDEVKFGKP
jgi:hypothetical protein